MILVSGFRFEGFVLWAKGFQDSALDSSVMVFHAFRFWGAPRHETCVVVSAQVHLSSQLTRPVYDLCSV